MELSKKLAPVWVKVEHEGEQLEFLCQALTAKQFLNVGALIEDGRHGDAAWTAASTAVRDWRGFTRDGEPVPFSRAALEQAFAPAAMGPALGLLFAQIMARSQLTDTERKN